MKFKLFTFVFVLLSFSLICNGVNGELPVKHDITDIKVIEDESYIEPFDWIVLDTQTDGLNDTAVFFYGDCVTVDMNTNKYAYITAVFAAASRAWNWTPDNLWDGQLYQINNHTGDVGTYKSLRLPIYTDEHIFLILFNNYEHPVLVQTLFYRDVTNPTLVIESNNDRPFEGNNTYIYDKDIRLDLFIHAYDYGFGINRFLIQLNNTLLVNDRTVMEDYMYNIDFTFGEKILGDVTESALILFIYMQDGAGHYIDCAYVFHYKEFENTATTSENFNTEWVGIAYVLGLLAIPGIICVGIFQQVEKKYLKHRMVDVSKVKKRGKRR